MAEMNTLIVILAKLLYIYNKAGSSDAGKQGLPTLTKPCTKKLKQKTSSAARVNLIIHWLQLTRVNVIYSTWIIVSCTGGQHFPIQVLDSKGSTSSEPGQGLMHSFKGRNGLLLFDVLK